MTAVGIAAGRYVAVGDDEGWIVLPPAEMMARWAREALLQQELAEVVSVRPILLAG